MARIKKWTVFSIFMLWMFVIYGITVFVMYVEHGVDPDIIPLSHDQIGYVLGAIIGVSILAVAIYMLSDVGSYFKGSSDRERILKEGKSAKAKIIKLDESGEAVVTVNDQPFVDLTLEIYDGDKKPYQAKIQTILSRLAIPQFQPGNMLRVKIDKKNPQNVVIDTRPYSS